MLLEKEEFKRLKKPYAFSPSNLLVTINCIGHQDIGSTMPINVTFTDIGIFIEPILKKKAFIDYKKITDVDIDIDKLYIESNDYDAQSVIFDFKSKKYKTINTIFYLIHDKIGTPIPNSLKRDINFPVPKGALSSNVIAQKMQMMEEGKVFCPKCLSTHIVATQKNLVGC